MKLDAKNKLVTMIELHCETDFVAKTDKFRQGLERVIETLHHEGQAHGLYVGAKDMTNVDRLA